jgi:hypothetical protein
MCRETTMSCVFERFFFMVCTLLLIAVEKSGIYQNALVHHAGIVSTVSVSLSVCYNSNRT